MPSTVIQSFEYNVESTILTITFTSGLVYDYLDVPESIYLEMKSSFAKGIYFNQHVKAKYRAVKRATNN